VFNQGIIKRRGQSAKYAYLSVKAGGNYGYYVTLTTACEIQS